MKSPRDQWVNLGLHAACWALLMCHHELCPTLVSDPVQLSYTEAAPWLYKKMVYGCSTRKTSSGIVTLVPCHLMVTITHAKHGISRFHLLVPYLGRRFHWLSLNYKVPRQLSYGAVVPELYEKSSLLWLNKEDFWMELLYWYPIGLCQIKQQKWTMHVFNPTGLNCFCK